MYRAWPFRRDHINENSYSRALWVSGTEQKALPKLDIHEVSQLNVCSEVYDGTDYAVMRAFVKSEDIGVLSSKRFPELVMKQ